MRVIGRNKAGQLVGCFERQSGEIVGEQYDEFLRQTAQVVLKSFRESIGWLYAIGGERFELVG